MLHSLWMLFTKLVAKGFVIQMKKVKLEKNSKKIEDVMAEESLLDESLNEIMDEYGEQGMVDEKDFSGVNEESSDED